LISPRKRIRTLVRDGRRTSAPSETRRLGQVGAGVDHPVRPFDRLTVRGEHAVDSVLSGRSQRRPSVRPVLAGQEYLLGTGEAAEFDTRLPHWIGSADSRPAEVPTLFGAQGERAHLAPSRAG
jgi:hypothetical protein